MKGQIIKKPDSWLITGKHANVKTVRSAVGLYFAKYRFSDANDKLAKYLMTTQFCIQNISQTRLERLIIIPLIFILASCNMFNSDDASRIVWHDEDLSDYVIYAYTPFIDFLTIIDVLTGEILKTLEDLDGIQSVVTNKDGTRLYVSTGTLEQAGADPGEIIKINTETWEREIIFEHAAELLSNANGDILFITKHIDPDVGPVIPERILGRIDPMHGAITLIDTLDVEWRTTNDRHSLEISEYAPEIIALNSEKQLYRYNYDTGDKVFLFEDINFNTLAARMHLSYDSNYLLIPGGPVLDLTNEKVIGSVPTWRLGTAALRRDMKEVYITDPGGYLRDPLPSGKIAVYDPNRNRIVDHIRIDVNDPYYHTGADRMTDMILLTEKERYAVVTDWMRSYFVIDLKHRKTIHFSTYSPDSIPNLITQKITLSRKPPGLKPNRQPNGENHENTPMFFDISNLPDAASSGFNARYCYGAGCLFLHL